jgi:hypothetical protein
MWPKARAAPGKEDARARRRRSITSCVIGRAGAPMRWSARPYFENSRRATYVQREYAERNPREHAGYDEHCWGLTACDGPSDEVAEVDGEPHDPIRSAA